VRYGGEELMAILPDTSRELARMVAERLCVRMREAACSTTCACPAAPDGSFGVATLLGRDRTSAPDRSRRRGALPRQGGRARPHRLI
jgi:PleD family two-component response regulator